MLENARAAITLTVDGELLDCSSHQLLWCNDGAVLCGITAYIDFRRKQRSSNELRTAPSALAPLPVRTAEQVDGCSALTAGVLCYVCAYSKV